MSCCNRPRNAVPNLIPGNQGPQGYQGGLGFQGEAGVSGTGCQSVGFSDAEAAPVTGATEQILYEYNLQFAPLVAAGVPLPWEGFFGIVARVSSGSSTVRFRVGATNPGSTAGSTVVASQLVTGGTDASYQATGLVAALPATGIVQVTAQGSGAGVTTTPHGVTGSFTCQSPS